MVQNVRPQFSARRGPQHNNMFELWAGPHQQLSPLDPAVMPRTTTTRHNQQCHEVWGDPTILNRSTLQLTGDTKHSQPWKLEAAESVAFAIQRPHKHASLCAVGVVNGHLQRFMVPHKKARYTVLAIVEVVSSPTAQPRQHLHVFDASQLVAIAAVPHCKSASARPNA